ncbi:MAG: sodium:solute symporter family protein [Candidatus Hydrogenedentes bacterium]|nr:sodium:solute symporter family protein [Candidatus Hydrogenedentota bacterium]
MNLLLVGLFGYILVQLLIGLMVSRRMVSEDSYFLAGRSLGLAITTMTVFATWFGAETCIGSAGRVYERGFAGVASDPAGYAFCLLLMGACFAIPLYRLRLTTLGDLFRIRYSPGVERLAVLLMAPTSVMWAGAQIKAFGHVISASSAISVDVAITVAAVAVILYTVTGGLLADAITDLIQGIALIIGLVIVFCAVAFSLDEFGGVTTAMSAARVSRVESESGFVFSTLESWAIPILGSVVAQELVSRTLAAKSGETARNATFIAAGVYLVVGLLPVFVGLVGPAILPNLEDPEELLPMIAQRYLPPFLYVLFAGALVSAILSTVDSALLAASALVSHNLVVPLIPGLSEKRKVMVARAGVILFGVIAYVLALHAESVFEQVEAASAFGSAGIVTVVVFALFTRYGGVLSAAATLVVGAAVWLWGEYLAELSCPYLVALAAALSAYLLCGWLEGGSGKPASRKVLTDASDPSDVS